MSKRSLVKLAGKNFLFWLSRKIDYPLLPPDVVQINFTFRCNLSCKMCNMRSQMQSLESQGRQTEIDSHTFKKIIRETKDLGTGSILFIGGEPLLREDLFELVRYTRGLGLGAVIVTNGVLLHNENIKRCFESGVDWLSVSIDAASEGLFSKIRGEKVLGKIVENIQAINELKRQEKRDYPKVVAVCTIMDDNLEELMEVVKLCKHLEISRVLFQPVVANNIDQASQDSTCATFVRADRLDVLDKAIDALLSYKKTSLENFDFIGNSLRHLELIKEYFRGHVKPRDFPCYAGYNRLQIVQEGKVYFCVSQAKYVAAFGDIRHDSLKGLWFSRDARLYRKLIRKCRYPCLQWCSYRDDFGEWAGIFQKRLIANSKKNEETSGGG